MTSENFSSETVQSRKQRNNIIKELRWGGIPRILYPEKILLKNKGKLNFFQENIVSENLLPIQLHDKKCQRKFFVIQEGNLDVNK